MAYDGRANLINLRDRTPEERREIARKGGLMSAEAHRRRRSLREELEIILSIDDMQERVCKALVDAALSGSTSAFNSIRDTTGELPRLNVSADLTSARYNDLSEMTQEQIEIARRYLLQDNQVGRIVKDSLGIEACKQLLGDLLNEDTAGTGGRQCEK